MMSKEDEKDKPEEPEIRRIKIDVSRSQIENDLMEQLQSMQSDLAIKNELVAALKHKIETSSPKPTGGGTVPLERQHSEVFNSVSEGIDELYKRAYHKGDLKSKAIIDEMWGKVRRETVEKMDKEGFHIVQCPHCKLGIDLKVSSVCPRCGKDYRLYRKLSGDDI